MEDLRIAMILMALLSIVSFFLTAFLVRTWRPRVIDAAAAALVILTGVYVRLVWGQLWIVRWIPLSSVIVLANWFPLFLGALAGTFWVRMRHETFVRRLPIQALLIAAAIGSEIYVIPTNPPECGNEWIEKTSLFPWRVCRQTTPHTCSAAAAATILTTLGLDATEQEMAVLCLTRRGTTWLGLYHGLSARLAGTPYRCEFFECEVEELEQHIKDHPVLLCCELTDEVNQEFPDYQEADGWIPGVQHSVVLFAPVEGLAHINSSYYVGDPSQRQAEVWHEDDLARLWTGRGLRIVSR